MENTEENKSTPKYWMSLEQWRNDPEFVKFAENEFRSSPLQSEDGVNDGGFARRHFLQLMGASLALTSFGCVRRPAQKIIPYAKKPYDVVHGIPNFYASSFVDGLEGFGIVVTTRDGRPTKLEGNPEHPANVGGMSARAHAQILKLYDPDRATGPKRNLQNEKRTNRETINVTWDKLDADVVGRLKKGKVAVLTNTLMSPSARALMSDFTASFGAKHYQYDDIGYGQVISAQKDSFGQAVLPRFNVEKAKYIVAVNCDFLGTWLTPTVFQRQFAEGRKADAEMNKLVVFESLYSMTGANADERHRIRPSQSLDVIMALISEIVVSQKNSLFAGDANVSRALIGVPKVSGLEGVIKTAAAELWKNRGQSLVLAGGLTSGTENAEAIQIAVNFLNAVLENEGKTVNGSASAILSGANATGSDMSDLLKALNSKEVNTLIINGCNPLYSMPADSKIREALSNIEVIVYAGDRNDETGRFADYLATENNSLESWGDMQSFGGVVTIQQPTIRPLYDTRSFEECLLSWLSVGEKSTARTKDITDYHDYVQNYWKANFYKGQKGLSFDDFWVDQLQVGALETGVGAGGARSILASSLSKVKTQPGKSGFELALYSTVGLGDGKLANVSWLQEFPDPVTKICWDNYANFSPKDAASLNLKEGRSVKLTVGSESLVVPAHIQPGLADGVVGLAVGYGRQAAGKIADGVGSNAFSLAQWVNGTAVTAGLEVKVDVLKESTTLACTQEHHSMEGRQIIVEETLADYIKKPGGNIHRHKMFSMWPGHKYTGNKWGMTIDLNLCNGCGTCTIACQSENNIPTVGKKYVIQGREMFWIPIHRYYVGDAENPAVVNQPMPCMHCDNAPCEAVCPVAATVHSDEGTNDMIYNRCVGTRYCSNNCPYKVRRFNWFSYTQVEEPKNLALNPEVTQRFRGVMEKCTFCIHRIRNKKIEAKVHDKTLVDGDIKTACQQSCPTHAIVFGDLNNPESAVNKKFNGPQSYELLEELNTKPSVRFQVKVRNVAEIKGSSRPHHEENNGEEGHHG